ncbi:hypothetical protein AGOR_G00231870 [Albula goreensis]|uniref:Non-muscle caldesmon n=1 Tax=Albula goreensis TaxID=1534307 RepID=A0A8T3CEP0_9TELE|nr:hypothetical protein AGOR_G00231870 [Albula goreensis]
MMLVSIVDKPKPDRESALTEAIMEDDFDRRRELRRQKREEMRLEAERMSYGRMDEDDEEAARERRRRARQERLRNRENEEGSTVTESTEINNTNSVTDSGTTAAPTEDDQALLDRLAKREERRQRRMKEALERQKELDPTITDGNTVTDGDILEERRESRRSRRHEAEEEEEQQLNNRAPETNAWKEKEEEKKEEEVEEEKPGAEEVVPPQEEEAVSQEPVAEPEEEVVEEKQEEVVEEKPRRSYLREQEVVEEKTKRSFRKEEVFEKKGVTPSAKQQNGAVHDNAAAKHKKPERTLSSGSLRSPEAEEQDDAARQEAERKLEELKRRRDDAESEEFEKMRQKQQEAEAELEELKKKREERRKVLEEEEKQRKQEREEKKAREEEEKRRMKEEIEKRRAEAAEKRQKEETDGEPKKPFKCVSPRGSSLKIGERAEFLNKSAQKSSTVKTSHVPVVSKIDNRLEQYTTALQSSKDPKSPRAGASDLPVVTDGIRNIKSMWEKGNVFSSPGGAGNGSKETAGMKIGVAGRINDWLNKTPEPGKTPGKPSFRSSALPDSPCQSPLFLDSSFFSFACFSLHGRGALVTDLKPGDVTNKRSLWENKGSSPTKVAVGGKTKAVTNAGTGH